MAVRLVGENRPGNEPGRCSTGKQLYMWCRGGSVLQKCSGSYVLKGTSKVVARSIRNNARLSSEDQGKKIFE